MLSLPVLVSLGTFVLVLTSRLAYMTGGYGVTVWWTTDRQDFFAGIALLDVFRPPLALASCGVDRREAETGRGTDGFHARRPVDETRELYASFTLAFLAFVLPLSSLWLYDMFLLPVFYLAFPVLAYSNLLRPKRGRGSPFSPPGPSTGPASSRANTRLSPWMRLVAVGAAFAGAGIWTALELRAPWWPRGPELGVLEVLAAVLGVAGFAVLAIMFLVQTAAPTRAPNP